MNKALCLAALVSGCYLNAHAAPRLHDWTELPEGGSAVAHLSDSNLHLTYYGSETNHADGAHDDIVFIGRYVPFEGFDEVEVRVGDNDSHDAFGYRFKFDVINDNDDIIGDNRVVVYWDKL